MELWLCLWLSVGGAVALATVALALATVALATVALVTVALDSSLVRFLGMRQVLYSLHEIVKVMVLNAFATVQFQFHSRYRYQAVSPGKTHHPLLNCPCQYQVCVALFRLFFSVALLACAYW